MAAVQAQVMLPLNPTTSQFLTLTQELVLGIDPATPMPNRQFRELPGAERPFPARRTTGGSRWWAPTSRPRRSSRWAAGSSWPPDVPSRWSGCSTRRSPRPDRFAIVPLDDARDLWLRRDPLLVQRLRRAAPAWAAAISTPGAAVAWADGVDPDALARRIQAGVPGVNVTIPGELSRLLRQSTAFFSALLFGMGSSGS